MRNSWTRILSAALALVMFIAITPLSALAENRTDVFLPEVELGEDILGHDVFYLATTAASIDENSNAIYLLKVGRGGDAETESTALIKIADVTAKYGRDYIVRVRGGSEEVENTEDNLSVIEMMEGSEHGQIDIADYEQAMAEMENDPEAQAAYSEGLQAAMDFLEEQSGLSEKYGDEDPYADAVEDMYAQNADPSAEELPEGSEDAPDPDVVIGDGTETVTLSPQEEDSGLDPVQQASNLFVGEDAVSQRMTTDSDMFQDLQSVANVLTDIVVGAYVELTFAPGEKIKYLEILPLDNDHGDGDRMFYLILGAPDGTTTNSAASSCALTIVDDEECEPCVLSFSQTEYVHTPGEENVVVTVERTGAINQVVSGVVKTTGEGNAQVRRDYSEVDQTLVFPFGVSSLTVTIPVRTEYLTGDATFGLVLEPDAGCTVGTDHATVSLKGTYKNKSSFYQNTTESSAEDSYDALRSTTTDRHSLGVAVTSGSVKIDSPYDHGHADNYWGGDNKYISKKQAWNLMWKDSTILRDRDDVCGVVYQIADSYTYWIAGAQVRWSRSGSHAYMKVCLDGRPWLADWYTSYTKGTKDQSGGVSYPEFIIDSNAHFDMETLNMFPSEFSMNNDYGYRPKWICFYNRGKCDDCNNLWIYEIKPILRPFQINLMPANALEYLKEDGTRSSDNGEATKANIVDASTQAVLYVDESFTVQMPADANVIRYSYLQGLGWVAENGEWIELLTYKIDTGNKSLTYTLSEDNLSDLFYRHEGRFKQTIKKNTELSNTLGYANYSKMWIKPTFGYIDSTVTLRNPYDYPVTFTISNKTYTLDAKETRAIRPDDTTSFHKGDTLAVTGITINDPEASDNYKVTGLNMFYKIEGTEAGYTEDPKVFQNNRPIYISGSSTKETRLSYKDVILEPTIQSKDNQITVRIKTSELSDFETEGAVAGLLAQQGDTSVEAGYTYFTFANVDQTIVGKLYPITVTPKDGRVAVWTDRNTARKYTGNTLYFTAGSTPYRNILELSSGEKQGEVTLTGTFKYTSYDLRTMNAGSQSNVPAVGATLIAGSSGGTANRDGFASAGPISVTGGADEYIRFIVSVNGSSIVREIAVPQQLDCTIDISENFPDGVSPVTSNIFNDIQITGVMSDAAYQIIDGVNIPILSMGKNAQMTIRIRPQRYAVSMTTPDGVVETTKTETPISVQFVVYDSNDVYRGEFDVSDFSKLENGYRVFNSTIDFEVADSEPTDGEEPVPGFRIEPGDKLYLRLVTDRLSAADALVDDLQEAADLLEGEDGDTDPITEMLSEEYQYSDIFTGITFYSPLSTEIPPKQGFTSPVVMDFPELPLVGSTGMMLPFPFVTVGCMRIENGYRIYFGISVMQIYDTIKGTHFTSMSGDDGQYWKDLFSIKSPFQTFASGFKAAWDQIGDLHEAAAAASKAKQALSVASLGAPQWTFDLSVGAYFNFAYYTIDSNTETTTTFKFIGMGAYLSVNVGFKVAWYVIIPVVFIPAYFGIEVNVSAMGYLGGNADPNISVTMDEAQHQEVNYSDSIISIDGGARGQGYVQLSLGIGLCGTLGIRVVGRVNFIVNWDPADAHGAFGFYISLSAGIIVDLFLFSVPVVVEIIGWPFGSFDYYANDPGDVIGSSGTPVGRSTATAQGFRLREGSGKDSEWIGGRNATRSAFAPGSTQILADNAYERADAQLITLENGTVVLAFIDSDNAKGDYQRTTLKLATYKNGRWSDPVAVSNDDTADFSPSIAETKDGRVLVAWVSTGANDIDENTPVTDYLNSMEVYAAFATIGDNGSIAMGEPVRITNDHRIKDGVEKGYYDCSPTVVCDKISGDAIIYYIKSGSTTTDGTTLANPYTNDCRVFYMIYNAEEDVDADGRVVPAGWLFNNFYYAEFHGNLENEQYMIDNFGGQRSLIGPTYTDGSGNTVAYAIPDFTAVGYNGLAVYAYTTDVDGNNSTDADKELYMQVYNFEQHETKYRIRITDDNVADSMPQFFRTRDARMSTEEAATHTKLFWYRDGRGVVYIDVTMLLQEGVNDDGTLREGSDENENSYVEPRATGVVPDERHAARQSADFRVVEDANGSLYILWTEGVADEEGNVAQEIFATSLIAKGDDMSDEEANSLDAPIESTGWSKPYRLTREGYSNDEIAVTLQDENLIVVHNRFRQTLNIPENEEAAEDGIVYNGEVDFVPIEMTDMKLVATVMEPCGAVETESITASYPDENGEPVGLLSDKPMGGTDTILTVLVSNNGLTDAKGYQLTLYAVDRNGNETQIGSTVESTEKLRPNLTSAHMFPYTLPDDVEGLAFKAVTKELKEDGVYFSNVAEYVSEPFEADAGYAITNLMTYQTNDGFRASFTVTNTGNAPSGDEDRLTVALRGPANLSSVIGEDACTLYSSPFETKLEPGESREMDIPAAVTPEMMQDYGFIEASFSVTRTYTETLNGRDYEGRRYLGDIAYADFTLTRPMNMALNDVEVSVDDTAEIICTMDFGDRFGGSGNVTYAVADLGVAQIRDGRVLGVAPGTTTLYATHAATGVTVASSVTVTDRVVRMTLAGEDVLSGDVYETVDGEILYRYNIYAEDLPAGGSWIGSAQIFLAYDPAVLELRGTEGSVDWTVNDQNGSISAGWASEQSTLVHSGDTMLTLYFAKVGEAEKTDVTFTENALGNRSAVAFVIDNALLEVEAETVDGSITFEAVVYGDANVDGTVTAADAAIVLRSIVGLSTITKRGALNADVDGDGSVTAADAAAILRYVVGLISVFPVQQP